VLFDDEMLDDSERLTDDNKAALDAEERGETYEAEPLPQTEAIENTWELKKSIGRRAGRFCSHPAALEALRPC
jgi:hypothetical protein